MDSELQYDLRLTLMRLGRRIRAERSDTDISETQVSVLMALHRFGPQSPGTLSERERVTPPSMNRTINGLVEAGYATRADSEDDRRKVTVAITAAGDDVVAETKLRRDAWFSQRLDALSPEELALLEQAYPVLRGLSEQ